MLIGGWCVVVGLVWAVVAQETTVMPLPGAATTPPVQEGTGVVKAAKAPKAGSNLLSGSGLLSGSSTNNEGMQITSDRMEFDYKDMVIAFDEHVRVVEPRYTMNADRVLVFLEGSNQIKRILAVGNVDILAPPDRHATCEKAVYDHTRGEIVMTGSPVVTENAKRLVGSMITVLLNEQRIVVDRGRVQLPMEAIKSRDVKP
jgi:lipopolysaccharide transport protein LptA